MGFTNDPTDSTDEFSSGSTGGGGGTGGVVTLDPTTLAALEETGLDAATIAALTDALESVSLNSPTLAALESVDLNAGTISALAAAISSAAPAPVSLSIVPIVAGAVTLSALHGWSLRNTFAGLTQIRLHFGADATGTDFVPINLAENETVTEFLDSVIATPDGLFVEIVAGTVDGVLYTVAV